MNIFNIISLLGGLALFLYGMRIMGDGLKHGSSSALKKAMEKVTNNPFVGFLLGLIVTCVIQSSTATIVITSGLVGAGIITLHQSLGIILGANLGTTITGQIIRLLDINSSATSWLNIFKPSTLAPVAAVIGIILIMAIKTHKANTVGGIAMGFAILFTGLLNMTAAVSPLSESAAFSQLFISLADKPFLGFLAGAAAAFCIQSSSATVGILQALSVTGKLTFSSIYSILIGIYFGDCVTTAIVCSIGAKADAKRTGAIHILVNLGKAILVVAGVAIFHKVGLLDKIWSRPITSGGIANTNTIFNLVCVVVLLPICGMFEKLSRLIIKDDPVLGESVENELKRLDDKLFNSPALALSSAHNAISTMARLSCNGVLSAMDSLVSYNPQAIDTINENEAHIDTLADSVSGYLLRLSPNLDAKADNDLLNYYFQCISEFERIGDYAVNLTKDIAELKGKNVWFSDKATQEFIVLRDALEEIMGYAKESFSERNSFTARHIEPIEEVMDDMVETLRNNHTLRMRDGQCTVDAGLSFLNILVNLERIADQCSNVGIYTISLSDTHVLTTHHDYLRKLHQGEDPLFNSEYGSAHQKYFGRLDAIE